MEKRTLVCRESRAAEESARLVQVFVLTFLALAAGGCGRTEEPHSVPAPSMAATVPFFVDPVACPQAVESSEGKLSPSYEAYLRAHPDLTHSITVRLRALPWHAEPCNGDTSDSAQCPARDETLTERRALNQKEIECVYEAFGAPGSLKQPRAQWYEPSRKLTTGLPVPVGSAFSALALWSQIEAVAHHPYVEGVEPTFGVAATLGVAPPEIRLECPAATDDPMVKVTDAISIQGQGRRPVVVELRRELMPELQTCQSASFCTELHYSGWDLTIVGRRMLSCVQALIDSKVQAPALPVGYATVVGYPPQNVPPFEDAIHAVTAFGLTLTWEEVLQVAKHPYVGKIWTSEGLSVEALPEGCPPNYGQPVVPPVCPTGTEPIDGKFTAASKAEWQASVGPNEVLLAVPRSAPVCPRPACPGRTVACPEFDKYYARDAEEALAFQTCVRSLITAIGGTVSPEALAPGANAIAASLTWQQIQTVAAHPHVSGIDRAFEGTPPP